VEQKDRDLARLNAELERTNVANWRHQSYVLEDALAATSSAQSQGPVPLCSTAGGHPAAEERRASKVVWSDRLVTCPGDSSDRQTEETASNEDDASVHYAEPIVCASAQDGDDDVEEEQQPEQPSVPESPSASEGQVRPYLRCCRVEEIGLYP
jgi:hypothetical protein